MLVGEVGITIMRVEDEIEEERKKERKKTKQRKAEVEAGSGGSCVSGVTSPLCCGTWLTNFGC